MDKEQIKNKIFEYFVVSDLGELIAKTPKEWMDCCNSVLCQGESPFEKSIKNFPEDWKTYFRQLIDGQEWYVNPKDTQMSWLGNVDAVRTDKFLLFLYYSFRESNILHDYLTKQGADLRQFVHDFYSLTPKEFKNKYGISNVR